MGYATVLVVLILLALWLNGGMMQSASQRIEYSTLLEMIDNDQVAQVAIRDNELVGLLKDSSIPPPSSRINVMILKPPLVTISF